MSNNCEETENAKVTNSMETDTYSERIEPTVNGITQNGGGAKAANACTDISEKRTYDPVECDGELTTFGKKIKRQIEYYFGDYNLPKDKYLQDEIKKDDDGWVAMSVFSNFKRLMSICEDLSIILSVIKKYSQLLEADVENGRIRRSPDKPLPEYNEARREELMGRTVYAKGLPKDGSLSIEDVDAFFSKYGEVENVQMRNWRDKATGSWNFKGSVFVVFAKKDHAEAFLSEESTRYSDHLPELLKMWQSDYILEKKKENAERKQKDHDEKYKRQAHKAEVHEKLAKEREDEMFQPGYILHLKGFNEETTRENIKDKLGGDFEAKVGFIDYSKGQSEAWVRLHKDTAASEIQEKIVGAGKLMINEVEITSRALEGEEEETYLKESREKRQQSMQTTRGKKRGHGGRGRGRGGKRGRY